LVVGLIGATVGMVAPDVRAAAQTFTVNVDGQPPTGEPWAFLRFFPGPELSVHQGDVVDFAFSATDTPHTATLTPSADPEAWRKANQGPGGPYETEVADSTVGGDDKSVVLNPAVGAPSDPTCGTQANPCAFAGSGVMNSGIQFPNPSAQPSFFVAVNAPVGTYSFLCLLHPGMEVPLNVVANATAVPSPDQVSASAAKQLKNATNTDGKTADAIAQTVKITPTTTGDIFKVRAGGVSNNVSANEYPDHPVKVHTGDQVRFIGMPEIHTATFPRSAVKDPKYAFIQGFCEQPGADVPAQSPTDCTDPTKFESVFNPLALAPSKKNGLSDPSAFRNSGLLVPGTFATFIAKKPGVYTFVCLVHGPEMTSKIKVVG
jgi:plastocyanin